MSDIKKAIGYVREPVPVSWNQRDLLLYAASIGSTRDDLQHVYELDPNWHVFPTYPLVLALKGASTDLNSFEIARHAGGDIPGMPKTDAKKGVHAEQSITILKEIPPVSGEGWKILKKVVRVKDTGKGLISDEEHQLVGPNGLVYASMISSGYAFGNYGLNGFNESVASPQPAVGLKNPPSRAPDAVLTQPTFEAQAMIYRLSGDYNPLHADPSIGSKLGFKGAILHGLCTYGHAARTIINEVANGDGRRLYFMGARFSSPVMPGDTFESHIWLSTVKAKDLANGGKEATFTRVDFIQKVKETGKVVLGGGVALIRETSGKPKL